LVFKWSVFLTINGPSWTRNLIAIQFPVWFSNGYNKIAAENGPVLGWPIPAEMD
jgi:hypothetical protein